MEKANMKQTVFDTLVTNQSLQLLKAVLPYIDFNAGKSLAFYVKFIELQNAMKLRPNSFMVKDENGNYKAMQSDKPLDFNTLYPVIKDFLDEEQREMIESMLGMMDLFSMDEDAKESMFGDYMEMFKDMF